MAGNVLQNPFSTVKQSTTKSVNDPNNRINDPNATLNDPANLTDPNADPKKKAGGEGDDPMLSFDKLWEDDPVDPNNPPKPEPTTFLPTIDPAKLQENFNKIDFAKYATPEELAAITAGGENATKAHQSILNKSLRQAMLTMFNASTRMIESGLSTAQERFLGKVPSHVKNIMVEGNLTKSSKLMSNPAFAPMVEAARQRYQEKFPKSTPDQISAAVEKYMQAMVTAATVKDEAGEPTNVDKLKKGDGSADWEDWIKPELEKSL